ncbi:MAG TPA: glycosyltransferase family 2 protein [Chitinophagaceae bacterium]
MNAFPRVAIVILNWNGRHFLEQFLPSVVATTYRNLEIVVIDNGSSDDSVVFLGENFPGIRLVQLTENLGFAKGYNKGLASVDAEYFLLLNSDVRVEAGWIEPMVIMLQNDETLAGCQPKILSYAHPRMFDYAGGAGGWIDRFGYPFARGRIFDYCEEDNGQYDHRSTIFWASGAAMFIRARIFWDVNGFDEYFFAHQEEIDLCWRIQLAGHYFKSCPQSIVYHVGGGTLPRGNTRKTFLNFRNNQIMLAKNLSWAEKWWKIPFRIFLDTVSAVKGLFIGDGGYFVAILRAHLAFGKWILFKQRQSNFPKTRTGKLRGVFQRNVVWEHFAKKKRRFTELVKNDD